MNGKQTNEINDRCNISEEGEGNWAPVHVRSSGDVICGCVGCVEMRKDDYDCTCPIDYDCNCVEVAMYGLCECDAEDHVDCVQNGIHKIVKA